jgi:hypothetical protein
LQTVAQRSALASVRRAIASAAPTTLSPRNAPAPWPRPAVPGEDAPLPVRSCEGSPRCSSQRQAHGGPHRNCQHGGESALQPTPPIRPTPSGARVAMVCAKHPRSPPPRRRSEAPELHRTPAGSPTQRLQLQHGRKIIGSFISSCANPRSAAAFQSLRWSSRLPPQIMSGAGSSCRQRAGSSCCLTWKAHRAALRRQTRSPPIAT